MQYQYYIARARREYLSAERIQLIIIALTLALLYWIVGLLIQAQGNLFVWGDQLWTFKSAMSYVVYPYEAPGFFNTPWAMLALIPFDPMPLEIAAFIQIVLYFVLLALIVEKFGGNRCSLLVALTSALALDAALEINIDWLVCIGLLVPPTWSGPFLLIKPQTAWGYVFSFSRQDFLRATIVVLATSVIAFLLWGNWPLQMLENIQHYKPNILVNIAPLSLILGAISVSIGLAVGLLGFWKSDPVLCVLAGLFFVPYTAPSSVLVAFTLLATRWPHVAFIASICTWMIVARIIL